MIKTMERGVGMVTLSRGAQESLDGREERGKHGN